MADCTTEFTKPKKYTFSSSAFTDGKTTDDIIGAIFIDNTLVCLFQCENPIDVQHYLEARLYSCSEKNLVGIRLINCALNDNTIDLIIKVINPANQFPITTLDLGDSTGIIEPNVIKNLLDALAENTTIKELDMGYMPLSKDTMTSLIETAKKNVRLETIQWTMETDAYNNSDLDDAFLSAHGFTKNVGCYSGDGNDYIEIRLKSLAKAKENKANDEAVAHKDHKPLKLDSSTKPYHRSTLEHHQDLKDRYGHPAVIMDGPNGLHMVVSMAGPDDWDKKEEREDLIRIIDKLIFENNNLETAEKGTARYIKYEDIVSHDEGCGYMNYLREYKSHLLFKKSKLETTGKLLESSLQQQHANDNSHNDESLMSDCTTKFAKPKKYTFSSLSFACGKTTDDVIDETHSDDRPRITLYNWKNADDVQHYLEASLYAYSEKKLKEIEIYLSGCELNDNTIELIIKVINSASQFPITGLHLGCVTGITQPHLIKNLLDALAENTTIEALDMGNIPPSKDTMVSLINTVKKNARLGTIRWRMKADAYNNSDLDDAFLSEHGFTTNIHIDGDGNDYIEIRLEPLANVKVNEEDSNADKGIQLASPHIEEKETKRYKRYKESALLKGDMHHFGLFKYRKDLVDENRRLRLGKSGSSTGSCYRMSAGPNTDPDAGEKEYLIRSINRLILENHKLKNSGKSLYFSKNERYVLSDGHDITDKESQIKATSNKSESYVLPDGYDITEKESEIKATFK